MLIRNVHSSLCATLWFHYNLASLDNVSPSLCQTWRQSVCTVHLFFYFSYLFSCQIVGGYLKSKILVYICFCCCWPAWMWPVWVCFGVVWVWVLCLLTWICSTFRFFYKFFFPVTYLLSLLSVLFSFTCDAWCDRCMPGKPKIKMVKVELCVVKAHVWPRLLLSLCLPFHICFPEWIHPPAYRCPLWQRQCCHAPAEPWGRGGLHSKGRAKR